MITAWRIITVLINDGDEENCDEMVRIIIMMVVPWCHHLLAQLV